MSLILHEFVSGAGLMSLAFEKPESTEYSPPDWANIRGIGHSINLSDRVCVWWLRTCEGSLEGVGSFPADWLNLLGRFWEMTPREVHRAVWALRQKEAA